MHAITGLIYPVGLDRLVRIGWGGQVTVGDWPGGHGGIVDWLAAWP